MRRPGLLLLVLLPFLAGQAPDEAAQDSGARLTKDRREGTRRALILVGLPGDDEHRSLYAGVVEKLHKAMTERFGFRASEVLVRFGTESRPGDGPALTGNRGLSDREGIRGDVAELRMRLTPEETFWVIVLGHAHYDGRRSHLNLPGPDLSAEEFGVLFKDLPAREQVVFITTSASGFFLRPLAAPGRVVITATEPDLEVNETLFPLALAEVLAEPPAASTATRTGASRCSSCTWPW